MTQQRGKDSTHYKKLSTGEKTLKNLKPITDLLVYNSDSGTTWAKRNSGREAAKQLKQLKKEVKKLKSKLKHNAVKGGN